MLLLLVPALALAQKAPQGVTYNAEIIKVSDGDTVVIAAPFLPAPLKPQLAVRIFGVDTPEKGFRAKCESENQRGLAASEFTKKQWRLVPNAKWSSMTGISLVEGYLEISF